MTAIGLLRCQVCNWVTPTAIPRELWMQIGAVEMGVRSTLCDGCAVSAPEKIRAELASPLIAAMLKIAGARLGFVRPAGTAAAPVTPGKPAA